MRFAAALVAAGLLAACQAPRTPAPAAAPAPAPQVAPQVLPPAATPAKPSVGAAAPAPAPAPAPSPAPAPKASPEPSREPLKVQPSPKPPPSVRFTPAPEAAPKAPPAPAKAAAPAPAKPVASAPAASLDLKSLEQRLKETGAIGVLTKLSLKNQVDDLVDRFRAFHGGQRPPTLAELRPSYELLLMKVLSLLQDNDVTLAKEIDTSREAIWSVLSDREKFTRLN